MKYVADRRFNCLCPSPVFIADAHTVKEPAGLPCDVCIEPFNEPRCCCCCFKLAWPGFTSLPLVCDLIGTGPLDVWLAETDSECADYNSDDPRCVWVDSYYDSPTFTLRLFYNVDTEVLTATLTAVFTTVDLPSGATFTYLSTDFNCQDGGTFNLTSVVNMSTCLGFSYPTVVNVSTADCADDPFDRA